MKYGLGNISSNVKNSDNSLFHVFEAYNFVFIYISSNFK